MRLLADRVLIFLKPPGVFYLMDPLKEERSVDANHEKSDFILNFNGKQISTILTNPSTRVYRPAVLSIPAHHSSNVSVRVEDPTSRIGVVSPEKP